MKSFSDERIPMTAVDRLGWALAFCQRAQLRLTEPRKKMLRFLAANRLPASIEMILLSEGFAACCAETTVYRTLILFREVDLVRQINLPGKTSYFVLNMPGEPCDFLVCRRCGRVKELPLPKAVMRLEQKVAAETGFAAAYHELQVYGICPDCQVARHNSPPATKLASLKRPPAQPTSSQ
jgi:Fur family ferric uptake transcriptional regulator